MVITQKVLKQTYRRIFDMNMKMGLDHVEANFRAMECLSSIARQMDCLELFNAHAESFYIPLIWANLGDDQ